MVSPAVGVDTIFSSASDLPAAQEENPTAQTAPIFPATQPASVVSAASPIVQAETSTSPTTLVVDTEDISTAQAETAPAAVSLATPASAVVPITPASADADHLAGLQKRLDTLERTTSCNAAGLDVLELRTSDVRRLASGAADLEGRIEVLEARTSRSLDATVQMVQELTSSMGVMQVAVREVQELLC